MKGISKDREHLLNELTTLSAKVKTKAEIDNIVFRQKIIEDISSNWVLRLWWSIFRKEYRKYIKKINNTNYFDYSTSLEYIMCDLKIKMIDEFILDAYDLSCIRNAINYIQ